MSSDLQPPNSKLTGDVQADLKQLGKYRILRRIGAGGMGTVYLAEDTLLKRTVALKVLPKDRAENPILVRRFQSEARASAQLTHKNIVGVYDAGQADGYLYIALEYIDGIDLQEWLRKRETIPIKRSIGIIKQMAEALKHAHSKKLVHRDIKPANIMIAKDGTAKLADLGLARSVDETLDTTITRVGTTVGTVDYMSPEQAAHSKHADIRSDIYSLGCTWYHMLTGSPPFPEGDMTNKLRAHAENPIPDPREANNRVTDSIVAIMHRMMAKKKQDRYQNPQELLDELNNSSNLADDSSHLLATLLAEEEDGTAFVASNDSVEIEVQDESQSKLLGKTKTEKPPSRTPSLSKKTQRRKPEKKQKQRPKTEAQKNDEAIEENQSADRPVIRKPLKRARTAEELNEPEFATDVPQQSPRLVQKPNLKETRSDKQTKKKNIPSKSKKERPFESRQKTKTGKAAPPKKEPQKQSSLSPVDLSSDSKIDIDWAKAGLFIVIFILTIGFIWWGISKFSVDSIAPDINPYGENAGQKSKSTIDAQDGSLTKKSLSEKEAQQKSQNTGRSNRKQVASQSDGKIVPPRWVVIENNRPNQRQQDQFEVQRGKRGRDTFQSLEESLAAVQSRSTVIDLSAVASQEIHSTELKLKDRLTIRATRSKPILTFHLDENGIKKGLHSWLNVTGGTLELVGLHFVISNSTEGEIEFLKLNGTDLVLRNCTFTTIDSSPATCIEIGGKSANGNRIHIENCLIRGENISAINAVNVPCNIYCENSFFASRENDLFRLSLGPTNIHQSFQISNCTLIGGQSNLHLSKNENKESQSTCEFTLNRSLLIGIPSKNTSAIQLSLLGDNQKTEAEASRQNINLKMQHVRFVNITQLTTVVDKNETKQTVSDSAQWLNFWGETLPSDDLIHLENVENQLNQASLITSISTSQALEDIAHPGVGERSLLGADPAKVATVDAAAIKRQLTLNKILQRKSSQSQSRWSGKTVRFDLVQGNGLPSFLASNKCPNGTTVICFGSGIRRIPPIVLKNRKLRLKFEQAKGNPLRIEPADNQSFTTMFVIDGGEFTIEQGRFEIRKPNAEKVTALFLESKNGAVINLIQTQISQPLDAPVNASMITLGPAKRPNVVSIANSMISGSGPLIEWDATHQSLDLSNVIFASGSDSLTVSANKNPGFLSLNRCTFSQNKAALYSKGSNAPITSFANNCLFASPPKSSQQASIIRGESADKIRETIDWWESSCGYNYKIPTGISVTAKGPIGGFKTAWSSFWGSHRIYDLLDGTRAVVMSREIEDIDHLDIKDFIVSGSCQAAVWADDGKSIGARISKIGPQTIDDRPATPKRTRSGNKPVGF